MATGPDPSNCFRLLLLEAQAESLAVACSAWEDAHMFTRGLHHAQGVVDLISRENVQMVICDLEKDGGPGFETLQQIRRVHPHLPIVAVLPEQGFRLAVKAFRHGVYDVLTHPLDHAALRASRERVVERENADADQDHAQQAAKRSLDDLILLKAIGETMRSTEGHQRLLERIVALIQSALDVDIVSLMLADEQGVLRIRAAVGLPDDVKNEVAIAPGEGVAGHVLATGAPVLIDDLSSDGRFAPRDGVGRYRTGSLLSVPICYQQVRGVLNVNNKRNGEAFTGADQELLSMIAQQTALAIENMKLVGHLQEKNLEIEQAHQNLVKLHDDRTRFVCNLSHELKTPLTSVLGYADLLINFFGQVEQEQMFEYITSIYSEGRHLEKLLTGMLRLFSIDSGSENWDWQQLSLKNSVGRVLLQHDDRIEDLGLNLQLSMPEDLQQVWGDPDKLELLLDCLIDNAIKFNRREGILSIKAWEMTLLDRPMVYVQIMNQGQSVPRENAEDIFQEYSQLGQLDAGKPSGVGIGLATCRAILRQIGGEIFLEPVESEGTSIALLLPTEPGNVELNHD